MLDHPVESLELEGEELASESGGLDGARHFSNGNSPQVTPDIEKLRVVLLQQMLDFVELMCAERLSVYASAFN